MKFKDRQLKKRTVKNGGVVRGLLKTIESPDDFLRMLEACRSYGKKLYMLRGKKVMPVEIESTVKEIHAKIQREAAGQQDRYRKGQFLIRSEKNRASYISLSADLYKYFIIVQPGASEKKTFVLPQYYDGKQWVKASEIELEYASSRHPLHEQKVFLNGKMRLMGDKGPEIVEKLGGTLCDDINACTVFINGVEGDMAVEQKARERKELIYIEEPLFADRLVPERMRRSKEQRQTLSKLKKLFNKRDIESIRLGISLLDSLQDTALCESLLEGLEYSESEENFNHNRTFKGNGVEQPWLNTALTGLLACAPADSQKAAKLIKSVTKLSAPFASLEYLHVFANLEHLKLDKDHAKLPEDIEGLKGLDKLKTLDLAGTRISDLSPLASCTALKDINLNENTEIVSLKGLENHPSLQMLTCGFQYEWSGNIKLLNLDGLKGCNKLISLILKHAQNLENIDGLKGLPSLVKLEISGGWKLKNLDGLRGCNNLKILHLSEGNYVYSGREPSKYVLENVDGALGLPNLESVLLPRKMQAKTMREWKK